MAKHRLGRGLDSLLGRDQQQATLPGGPAQVPVAAIHPNRYQPRVDFDPEALNDLAESIASKGIIQPLLVRPDADGYELIAGERRWRAASQLGLEEVPVIIREVDDAESLEMAIIENIQREDLNPIEKAKAYKDLIERFALTQDEAAGRLGQKRSTVANMLRLLDLPEEIQQSVSRGTLTMGHARALLGLNDAQAMKRLARKIETEGLSVRAVEAAVQRINEAEPSGKVEYKSAHLKDIEDRLRRALGTRVTIAEGRGRGKITIEFYSNDDFDRILDKLQ